MSRIVRSHNRSQNDGYPKPVKHIELHEKFPKRRLALTVILIAVGVFALTYSLISFLTVDTGWTTIEVKSSQADCSEEFIFQYYLGAGQTSATAENKAVTALYADAVKKAYQLFHTAQEFDGVKNVYYMNMHPNEEIEVDELLYDAFSTLEKYGNRAVYMAPIYAQYRNLYGCNNDVETASFDIYQNEDIAEYFAEIISFAGDKNAVDVILLGDNRVKLSVSDAYLEYAAETGFTEFIDFFWIKNAFITDYIADTMRANGFVLGSISSYDGFVRNLDDSGDSENAFQYGFNIFNRDGKYVRHAAVMNYSGAVSIVFFRDFIMNGLDSQHYYEFQDGTTRTPYIDAADGYCKSAVSNMAAYSHESSCAEILLQMMPVYIADHLDEEKLSECAQNGIYSIYCKDKTILYNDSSLKLTDLYDKDGVTYTLRCIGE